MARCVLVHPKLPASTVNGILASNVGASAGGSSAEGLAAAKAANAGKGKGKGKEVKGKAKAKGKGSGAINFPTLSLRASHSYLYTNTLPIRRFTTPLLRNTSRCSVGYTVWRQRGELCLQRTCRRGL